MGTDIMVQLAKAASHPLNEDRTAADRARCDLA